MGPVVAQIPTPCPGMWRCRLAPAQEVQLTLLQLPPHILAVHSLLPPVIRLQATVVKGWMYQDLLHTYLHGVELKV